MATPIAEKESSKTQKAPLVVRSITALKLPLKNGVPPKRMWIQVQAGAITRETDVFNTRSQEPSWNTTILLPDIALTTPLTFSLYSRTLCRRKRLICTVETTLENFVQENHEATLTFAPPNSSSALVIKYDRNIAKAATELVVPSSAPSEKFGQNKVLDKLTPAVDVLSPLKGGVKPVASFLNNIEPFKAMFDRLAQLHPLAGAAWSLLTIAYDVVLLQQQKDQGIVDLYQTMLQTYEIANQKDILRDWADLRDVFEAMIVQTIECQIFISDYISGHYLRRLIRLDISVKTAAFRQAFVDLEKRFTGTLNRSVAVVTIGTHTSVKFLERESMLSKLHLHPQEFPVQPCLLGTRITVLAEIVTWMSRSKQEVMWLTGLPGTGKSTILSSVADAARKIGSHGRLGAFVRFDSKTMNGASHCITNLAYKLSQFDDRIAEAIAAVVKQIPDIADWALDSQFRELVVKPLESIEELQQEGPIVVLIDALDEIKVSPERKLLLKVLAEGFGPSLPYMRMIVSSRAHPDIMVAFNPQTKPHIFLYSLDTKFETTMHDIQLYFQDRFRDLADPDFDELCEEYQAVEELTKRACGLFIWASTTVSFIWEYPTQRLLVVLETSKTSDPEAALDSLYRIALTSALVGPGLNEDIKSDMRTILGAIMVAETPPGLDSTTIDGLLFFGGRPKTQTILRKLGCVISFGTQGGPLRVLHKSFDDFLKDQERCGRDWHIDEDLYRRQIIESCLRRLAHYFDSTKPHTAYPTPDDTSDIPNDITYASKYWIVHYCDLQIVDPSIETIVRGFFQKYFLRWLELASLQKFTANAVQLMMKVLERTNKQPVTGDRRLRYHAFQFLERFVDDIQMDPALVYLTALPFSPQNDLIRQTYSHHSKVQSISKRRNRLLSLATQGNIVQSVLFFPDGSKVASGSWDKTIMVWDSSTGAPLLGPMRGHRDRIPAISLSPDGLTIASASYDKTIGFWDATTGQPRGELVAGHDAGVTFVSFSPDGKHFASSAEDKTIRVWDAKTVKTVYEPIHAHDEGIDFVLYTPDGNKLVSGADDKSIRIWDSASGGRLDGTFLHDGVVMGGAFVQGNSTKFASCSTDSTIRLWDIASGTPLLEPIQGHENVIASVAFSRDGSMIVSGSWDKTIRIWDATTGSPLGDPIDGHSNSVMSVAFSPDESKIVSGAADNTIRVWDASFKHLDPSTTMTTNDRLIQVWSKLADNATRKSTLGQVTSVAFSPLGTQFMAGAWDGTVCLFDAETEALLKTLHGHDNLVMAVAYSRDGSQIISGSFDRTVKVWDTVTGALVLGPLESHEKAVVGVDMSPDKTKIVSSSWDFTIIIWDVSSRKPAVDTIRDHEGYVNSVRFSPKGDKIVSGSDDETIRLWDPSTGKSILKAIRGHTGSVSSVVFSHDGTKLLSASHDKSIRIWDALTGAPLREPLWGHESVVYSAVFFADSTKIISSSSDTTVRVWDAAKGRQILHPFQGHTSFVQSVAVSPDGATAISGSLDKSVRVWNTSTGKPIARPVGNENLVLPIGLSPDESLIAVGANDSSVQIWDVSKKALHIQPMQGHEAVATSMAFSSTGSKIISGSKDKSIRLWDISSGELTMTVLGHTDAVNSVAFYPDDSKIVSGSSDETVRVWDASNGKLYLDPIKGHTDHVMSVAVSPDGSKIVSGSVDGTIRVWDSNTGKPLFAPIDCEDLVTSVTFIQDGRKIAAVFIEGLVCTWDVAALQPLSSKESSGNRPQRTVLTKLPRNPGVSASLISNGKLFASMRVTNELMLVELEI